MAYLHASQIGGLMIKMAKLNNAFLHSAVCIVERYWQTDLELLAEPIKLECFTLIHAHNISWSEGGKAKTN